MKRVFSIFVIFGYLSMATLPAFAESKDHPDYKIVKKTVEDSICWALNKDFDRLYDIIAKDDNYFSLWLMESNKKIGWEAFDKGTSVWRTPDFEATSCEFKDLRINFSRSGNVAWYSTYLDDCYKWKGKPDCVANIFQTGVLEKRDGKWVHVQMHGSYPVDRIPEKYIRALYSGLFEKPEAVENPEQTEESAKPETEKK